jgi:argininosuccinate lyase
MFDAADSLGIAIAATAGMVSDMEPNADAMRAALRVGFPTATDLADYLVRELGIPFREAHHISGSIVALAASRGCDLDEVPLEEMQALEPLINENVIAVLGVDNAVAARKSYGGTAPSEVMARIADAKKRFHIE